MQPHLSGDQLLQATRYSSTNIDAKEHIFRGLTYHEWLSAKQNKLGREPLCGAPEGKTKYLPDFHVLEMYELSHLDDIEQWKGQSVFFPHGHTEEDKQTLVLCAMQRLDGAFPGHCLVVAQSRGVRSCCTISSCLQLQQHGSLVSVSLRCGQEQVEGYVAISCIIIGR